MSLHSIQPCQHLVYVVCVSFFLEQQVQHLILLYYILNRDTDVYNKSELCLWVLENRLKWINTD